MPSFLTWHGLEVGNNPADACRVIAYDWVWHNQHATSTQRAKPTRRTNDRQFSKITRQTWSTIHRPAARWIYLGLGVFLQQGHRIRHVDQICSATLFHKFKSAHYSPTCARVCLCVLEFVVSWRREFRDWASWVLEDPLSLGACTRRWVWSDKIK